MIQFPFVEDAAPGDVGETCSGCDNVLNHLTELYMAGGLFRMHKPTALLNCTSAVLLAVELSHHNALVQALTAGVVPASELHQQKNNEQ